MLIATVVDAAGADTRIVFAGLSDAGEWRRYVLSPDGEPLALGERDLGGGGFSLHPNGREIAVVGPDKVLRVFGPDGERRALGDRATVADDAPRYTQPYYSDDGRWLYAVRLPGGRSRQTHIVGFSAATGEETVLVRKRSAQFEPFGSVDGTLFYTTASCVDDCTPMIWELWKRERTTGRQYQLTLLNRMSTQPHLGADDWLYFASDAPDGYFHIWRMWPEPGSPPVQLTFGSHRDSEPATDARGALYFIRKGPTATRLMRLDPDGAKPQLVPLPAGVVDVRGLEVRG